MLKSKIEKLFEKHDCERISQGDILRDITFNYVQKNNEVQEYYFQYAIIITQDCNLEQYQRKRNEKREGDIFNQYIPNLLIIPSFPAESLRQGQHLTDLYNYQQDLIPSAKWKNLKLNKDERYHFIKGYVDMQVPDMVCDFKHFYTIGFDYISEQYNQSYLATVNELFRENLSQRFTNYLSRIGLPFL
jgi:hypothetical protein